MSKNFIIDIPLYPAHLMVSLNQTDVQLINIIKKWPGASSVIRFRAVDHVESETDVKSAIASTVRIHASGFILLRFHEPLKFPEHHGAIAHEIFHVIEAIAEYIDLKHCVKSSESFAYLIDYITSKFYKSL